MFIQVMEKFNRFPNTCNNKNNWIQNRQVMSNNVIQYNYRSREKLLCRLSKPRDGRECHAMIC